MTAGADQKAPSSLKLILGLLGYTSLFVVPAVGLVLLFPEYAPWIVLTALSSFLAVSGFLVGVSWERDEWPEEARRGLWEVLLSPIHLALPPKKGLTRHRWLDCTICCACLLAMLVIISVVWGTPIREISKELLLAAAIMVIPTLPPFFLGRAVYRWEGRRSGSLK